MVVDVNDQQNRSAFTSVLRVTLDSVQEFRTITTNAGAEYGHTSGGAGYPHHKSGTNVVHGSSTSTFAIPHQPNDFFANQRAWPEPS